MQYVNELEIICAIIDSFSIWDMDFSALSRQRRTGTFRFEGGGGGVGVQYNFFCPKNKILNWDTDALRANYFNYKTCRKRLKMESLQRV